MEADTVTATNDLSYCAGELRRHDHDRFLTCLFAPAARREALFALYAFNLEVARTAESVSEPMLGQIRLQWWREAIAGIYEGAPRRHEVVDALAAAVEESDLEREHFDRLIDARAFDLEKEQPADLAALEDYAEATSASLVTLALQVLGCAGQPAALQAGRRIGIAWAQIGLIRAVPFHAAQKRCYLPADLCREAGMELGKLFELQSSKALRAVAGQLARRAQQHLREARSLRREVPRAAIPALLLATLGGGYLATLRRAGYDPFRPAVQAPAGGRPWRLLIATLLGRY